MKIKLLPGTWVEGTCIDELYCIENCTQYAHCQWSPDEMCGNEESLECEQNCFGCTFTQQLPPGNVWILFLTGVF